MSQTDKQEVLVEANEVEATTSENRVDESVATTEKSAEKQVATSSTPVSKLAIFSLLLVAGAFAGIAYYAQQLHQLRADVAQQTAQQAQHLDAHSQAMQAAAEQQIAQLQQSMQTEQQAVLQQQQQLVSEMTQKQARLQADVAQLVAQQPQVNWLLTNQDAVQSMFVQLQQLAVVPNSKATLSRFLQQWQTGLSQQQVDPAHPLRVAIAQELTALAQLPNDDALNTTDWHAWQQWLAHIEIVPSHVQPAEAAAEGAVSDWLNLLNRFVRLTEVDVEAQNTMIQLRDNNVWQLQTQLELSNIRWGMASNQAGLVQQASQALRSLIEQAGVVLPADKLNELTAWSAWHEWQTPTWPVLSGYVALGAQVQP